MKKLLFILLVGGLLFSCSSKDDDNGETSLFGTWKLSEIKNDPGDGSGVFVKVDSEKILIFEKSGNITSNGSLCFNSVTSDSPSSGKFQVNEEVGFSGSIAPSGCGDGQSDIGLLFTQEKSVLYVYFPCIEGCAAKFIKIK